MRIDVLGVIYGAVYTYTELYTHMRSCIHICGAVYTYAELYTHMRSCIHIYGAVYTYAYMHAGIAHVLNHLMTR
jgi:hypothetical protein